MEKKKKKERDRERKIKEKANSNSFKKMHKCYMLSWAQLCGKGLIAII